MLQCQLIERVLPYVDTQMSTVLFKLLGTLRMLVDGQGKFKLYVIRRMNFVSPCVSLSSSVWLTVYAVGKLFWHELSVVKSVFNNSVKYHQ